MFIRRSHRYETPTRGNVKWRVSLQNTETETKTHPTRFAGLRDLFGAATSKHRANIRDANRLLLHRATANLSDRTIRQRLIPPAADKQETQGPGHAKPHPLFSIAPFPQAHLDDHGPCTAALWQAGSQAYSPPDTLRKEPCHCVVILSSQGHAAGVPRQRR